MRPTVLLLAATIGTGAAYAQPPQPGDHAAHAAPADDRPAELNAGIRGVHFPITTRREEAQKYFDQGLTYVYAFNHDEAVRSFARAADIDPASPMPHWGIALALGPNINQELDQARHARAYEAVQTAVQLATRAPAKERAFVTALSRRYSKDPKADLRALAVDYKDAMRQLVRTYPNDMHAATLYAESLMNLNPWKLWTADGAPVEGTNELIEVLERVLEREPDHVGANHYYIHATEASLTPERGIPSAKRLETLVPAAGHLVHMPAHTYMRTGNYAGAVSANAKAAEVDRKYIEDTHAGGFYPAMYYNHNLDFLAAAAMMTGQFAEALKAGRELTANVTPLVAGMPMLEPFATRHMAVLLRFGKWADALALPAPDPTARILTAFHHFGRGVAHAALGAVPDAEREQAAYEAARRSVPPGTAFNLNTAEQIFTIADHVLAARIAAAKGDADTAVAEWRAAVEAEDTLSYNEPPDWFYPTRESLGAALLRIKRYEQADLVFRQDLEKNPDNGRSLFGRWQGMRASDGDIPATLLMRRRFTQAWSQADVTLRLEEF